jgi:hypothetical protein
MLKLKKLKYISNGHSRNLFKTVKKNLSTGRVEDNKQNRKFTKKQIQKNKMKGGGNRPFTNNLSGHSSDSGFSNESVPVSASGSASASGTSSPPPEFSSSNESNDSSKISLINQQMISSLNIFNENPITIFLKNKSLTNVNSIRQTNFKSFFDSYYELLDILTKLNDHETNKYLSDIMIDFTDILSDKVNIIHYQLKTEERTFSGRTFSRRTFSRRTGMPNSNKPKHNPNPTKLKFIENFADFIYFTYGINLHLAYETKRKSNPDQYQTTYLDILYALNFYYKNKKLFDKYFKNEKWRHIFIYDIANLGNLGKKHEASKHKHFYNIGEFPFILYIKVLNMPNPSNSDEIEFKEERPNVLRLNLNCPQGGCERDDFLVVLLAFIYNSPKIDIFTEDNYNWYETDGDKYPKLQIIK